MCRAVCICAKDWVPARSSSPQRGRHSRARCGTAGTTEHAGKIALVLPWAHSPPGERRTVTFRSQGRQEVLPSCANIQRVGYESRSFGCVTLGQFLLNTSPSLMASHCSMSWRSVCVCGGHNLCPEKGHPPE